MCRSGREEGLGRGIFRGIFPWMISGVFQHISLFSGIFQRIVTRPVEFTRIVQGMIRLETLVELKLFTSSFLSLSSYRT